tara:strand:- start:3959 stop:4789 length:831 start_codon:yes stop_codon:yes gene_type:complete
MHHLKTICLYAVVIVTQCYNLVPQPLVPKQKLYFFPASLKNSIPQELYHAFLDKLKTNYDVKYEMNPEEIESLQETNQEILLLSHSSGANQLLETYDSLPETLTKKAVLIDPLDFKKYKQSYTMPSIQTWNETILSSIPTMPRKLVLDLDEIDDSLRTMFEKDYLVELFQFMVRNEEEKQENNKDNILLLNHKRSSQWRFFPVVPPIHWLQMDLTQKENTTITTLEIDDYSHFDILDRPWANALNKMTMTSKSQEEHDAYIDTIIPMIDTFYKDTL